ncbi:hypothetical protein [Nostoc sp.]|uniref:hypothetical protein n=1 Tax=Nostoc sp. TaxID=1180 RepID=UPI002FF740EF
MSDKLPIIKETFLAISGRLAQAQLWLFGFSGIMLDYPDMIFRDFQSIKSPDDRSLASYAFTGSLITNSVPSPKAELTAIANRQIGKRQRIYL